MTMSWNEAARGDPPPMSLGSCVRLCWRAPLALALTGVCLLLHLGFRALARLWPGANAPARAILRIWGRGALGLFGLRFARRGQPMQGPGAIVANHASWLDIVALLAGAPVAFVSKSEVAGWPVIGAIGRAIGTVFIDRRATQARRQSEVLLHRLWRGDRLGLFPEGTSTDGRRVLPFKSSLFSVFFVDGLDGCVRVQPVSIRYRARADLPRDFYGWWGDMGFAGHLRDVLAFSCGGRVRVTYHPALRASDFASRKELAIAAEASVRAGFTDPD